MSEQELIEYIQNNLENSPMIDTNTGISAIKKLAKIAEKERVEWALARGIAMHLYGSPRLTKDVDVVSEKVLSLEGKHRLSFGGISYEIKVGKKIVTIDWIFRNDDYIEYYQQALKDAVKLPDGMKVLTPEWLVILKSIAGRPKDRDDAVFLLKNQGKLNRDLIKENVVKVGGEDAWRFAKLRFRELYDLADNTNTTEDKYYLK
ncbi:MAG: hypothetical protein ACR2LT_01060 [Pyrinomonadaceae bacterium]